MIAVLRVALAIGGLIDAYVAILAIVFPQSVPTLLDIPAKDALTLLLGGGEYAVAATIYALALANPRRFHALLWICALDQLFAVVIPSWLIAHHQIPATWKTVAPIPLQFAMAIVFVAGTRLREETGWRRLR